METEQANPVTGADAGFTIEHAASRIEGILSGRTAEPAASEKREEEEAPASTASTESNEQSNTTATEEQDAGESEAPKEQTEAEQPRFSVKIDGKEQEVTLEELRAGYQRQADYTRKTMATAEERKAAEAEKAQIAQERQYYAQTVQQYVEALQANQGPSDAELQRLSTEDPAGYVQALEQRRQHEARFQRAQSDLQIAQAKQRDDQARARQEHTAKAAEKLVELVPEWRDEGKAKAGKAEVAEYLVSQGYTPDLVSTVNDPIAVAIARKAALYDKLMAQKSVVEKKVTEAPKITSPGAATNAKRDMSERETAYSNSLRKTGSVDDAARLIAIRMRK